jgi:hypothetical protein
MFISMPTGGKKMKLGRIRLLHAKCKELLVPKHHAMTVKLQSLLNLSIRKEVSDLPDEPAGDSAQVTTAYETD